MHYSDEESNFVAFTSDTSLHFKSISERSENDFNFDRIFPMNTTQKEIYEYSAKEIVDAVLDGYNGTVFAYGQTSSGKTFSMTGIIGDPVLEGIIPRMIQHVFYSIMNSPERQFVVKISMIEIYMEQIRDLLDTSKTNLHVRETKDKEIYIQDLSEHFVSNAKEVLDKITIGNDNRTIAYTNMNANSSRSHSLVIVTIQQENKAEFVNKTGKLYLIDLAGSEKATKTGATGKVLDEAKMINKSLTTLGMVINALTDGKSSHVPYRESKLTRVLTESLGGNAKTCLIITCSPSPFNESETLSTLRFGARAKNIKNKPKMNKEVTVDELKHQIAGLEKELEIGGIKIKKLEEFIKGKGFSIEEALLKTGDKPKEKEKEKEAIQAEEDTQEKIEIASEEVDKLRAEIASLKYSVHLLATESIIYTELNEELKDRNNELEASTTCLEQKVNEKEMEEEKSKAKELDLLDQIASMKKTIEDKEKYLLKKDGELLNLDDFYDKMKKYITMLEYRDKRKQETEIKVMNKMIIDIIKSITKEMKQEAFTSSILNKANTNIICDEAAFDIFPLSYDILKKNSLTSSPQAQSQSSANKTIDNSLLNSAGSDSSIAFTEEKTRYMKKINNYKAMIATLVQEKTDLISKLDLNFNANEKVIINKMHQQEQQIHYLSTTTHQITTQNSALNIKLKMLDQKSNYTSNKVNMLKKENEELRRIVRMKEETIAHYEKSLCFDNIKKIIQGGSTPKKKEYSPIIEENSLLYNSITPIKEFKVPEINK